jgi:hypothetical protein
MLRVDGGVMDRYVWGVGEARGAGGLAKGYL